MHAADASARHKRFGRIPLRIEAIHSHSRRRRHRFGTLAIHPLPLRRPGVDPRSRQILRELIIRVILLPLLLLAPVFLLPLAILLTVRLINGGTGLDLLKLEFLAAMIALRSAIDGLPTDRVGHTTQHIYPYS